MLNKEYLLKTLDNYLFDDGKDRDIVVLAKDLGINVGYCYTSKNFIAFTKIDENNRIIIFNKSRVNDEGLSKFILAYQLVEFVKSSDEHFCSLFKIECMENDKLMLVKDIVNRSNKYKKDKCSLKLKRIKK